MCVTQYNIEYAAERILQKYAKYMNKTYVELKSKHQRFEIYFEWNPRLKGIESTS